MWKIYLHIKLPGGLLNKQKSVHKIPLRQMDIWWILNPIVIHSLHISWSSWVCIRGSECVRVCLFLCACLCLCVCVCYVGKRVWTSQRYCLFYMRSSESRSGFYTNSNQNNLNMPLQTQQKFTVTHWADSPQQDILNKTITRAGQALKWATVEL